jgi:dCTP deaminase
MSVWSDKTLRERIDSVIDPVTEDQIDISGYRLRVGSQVYVTGGKNGRRSEPYSLENKTNIDIQPGQFALIQTYETVTVPKDTFGLISMRANTKFGGLLNVSGFHVDPGYSGKLIFSVFNAGPKAISLSIDDPIFMIWFLNLDQENEKSYKGDKSSGQINSKLINKLNITVNSLPELAEKVENLSRWQKGLRYSAIPIIAILATVVVPWGLKWIDLYSDIEVVKYQLINLEDLKNNNSRNEDRLEELSNQVQALTELNNSLEIQIGDLRQQVTPL